MLYFIATGFVDNYQIMRFKCHLLHNIGSVSPYGGQFQSSLKTHARRVAVSWCSKQTWAIDYNIIRSILRSVLLSCPHYFREPADGQMPCVAKTAKSTSKTDFLNILIHRKWSESLLNNPHSWFENFPVCTADLPTRFVRSENLSHLSVPSRAMWGHSGHFGRT